MLLLMRKVRLSDALCLRHKVMAVWQLNSFHMKPHHLVLVYASRSIKRRKHPATYPLLWQRCTPPLFSLSSLSTMFLQAHIEADKPLQSSCEKPPPAPITTPKPVCNMTTPQLSLIPNSSQQLPLLPPCLLLSTIGAFLKKPNRFQTALTIFRVAAASNQHRKETAQLPCLALKGPYKVRTTVQRGQRLLPCVSKEGKQTSIHYKR